MNLLTVENLSVQIEHKAIDSHQPHVAVEGSRSSRCGLQLHDLVREPVAEAR